MTRLLEKRRQCLIKQMQGEHERQFSHPSMEWDSGALFIRDLTHEDGVSELWFGSGAFFVVETRGGLWIVSPAKLPMTEMSDACKL
mmetsp:Transcript_14981/g.34614  ORF Transcript_14981/g.34614 Transcript_14981/m.34614 type:complete len:86 (-) Transcript_14981:272-529(-)